MISKEEFDKLEPIYCRHLEDCKCEICRKVQEYYDAHHSDFDTHPEWNRALRFS